MAEGLVEIYYKKLFEGEDTTPGVTLTHFYSELFGLPFSSNNIVLFNKLVKLYGRANVFRALVETYESGADFTKGFYGLISYICKNYISKAKSKASSSSLEEEIARRKAWLDKAAEKKFKIRNPFDGTSGTNL